MNLSDPTYYVKRCIGLPGETIQLVNGDIFIDNKIITSPETVCRSYNIWYNNYDSLKASFLRNKIDFGNVIQKYSNHVIANLDAFQKNTLESTCCIDSITIRTKSDRVSVLKSNFLASSGKADVASFLIPFSGMEISIDSVTLAIYGDILRKCENADIKISKGLVTINSSSERFFKFKHDYYYLIGDNRDNSSDSRSFGPIPKNFIEGRVVLKI